MVVSIKLIPQKAMNHTISHIEGVKGAVYVHAAIIHARGEALLAAHRQTGAARVTLTRGDTDSFINLEDKPDKKGRTGVMGIEFGHVSKGKYGTGKFIPGLYILHTASGLAPRQGARRGKKRS